MKPNKPRNTESRFATNSEIDKLAGKVNWKRDGNIKDISVALYDIDYAVKWHIENIIAPTVMEENAVLSVPVLFAAGEKWASVQKHGYLRDNQGKLLTPLIMIKRNSVTKREDIQDVKVLESSDARITFERKYTKQNRYDRLSLSNRTPAKEFYSVDVPKYVQIDYELICWTNNTVQLNELVEQIIWFDGKAFGDAHKFITHIDPPSFEAMNNVGEDRLVRASMPMRTKGYILNTHGPNAPSMYKLNPITRVQIGIEVDTALETLTAGAGAVAATSIASVAANTGGGRGGSSADVNDAITYLNINRQLTGTVTNSTTVSFNSGWVTAPSGMTATSIDNFIFYHKQMTWDAASALIPRSAIVSFTHSGNVSTLVLDATQLDYELQVGDKIVGVGKFTNQDTLA